VAANDKCEDYSVKTVCLDAFNILCVTISKICWQPREAILGQITSSNIVQALIQGHDILLAPFLDFIHDTDPVDQCKGSWIQLSRCRKTDEPISPLATVCDASRKETSVKIQMATPRH